MKNAGVALLVTLVAFGAMTLGDESAGPPVRRLVWEHSEGICRFVDKGEGDWAELDRQGKVFLRFKETRRTMDFVDLFDATRGYNIRLYKDSLLIKGGKGEFHRFDDFTRFYDGRWVK